MCDSELCNVKKYFKDLKEIWRRNKPSIEHETAWLQYEKVLMYRCNFGFFSYTLFNMVQLLSSSSPIDKSN